MSDAKKPGGTFKFPGTDVTVKRMGYGAMQLAGEDPDRYNPPGGHSHGTPLHHAAGGGHEEVVRLLVERGARLDLKDVLWHATPADWAAHEGKTEIEAYLRAKAKKQ